MIATLPNLATKYTVTCPACGTERPVGYKQFHIIQTTGKHARCIRCAQRQRPRELRPERSPASCGQCGKVEMLTRTAILLRRKDRRDRCRECAKKAKFKPNTATCGQCGETRVLTRPGALLANRRGSLCYRCALKSRNYARGKDDPKYKGTAHIPASLLCRWFHGAARREIAFQISIEEIEEIWQKQSGKCALTGIPLTHTTSDPAMASLDRIDSSGPYIAGNVQLVCAVVNRMKGCLPEAEFIRLCGIVAAHRRAE